MESSSSSSLSRGLVAVFAVSGSVVFLAHHVYKHLAAEFMDTIEYEFGSGLIIKKHNHNNINIKRVRFAIEEQPSSTPNNNNNNIVRGAYRSRSRHHDQFMKPGKRNNNNSRRRRCLNCTADRDLKLVDQMPLNWRIMYNSIIRYKTEKGCPKLS